MRIHRRPLPVRSAVLLLLAASLCGAAAYARPADPDQDDPRLPADRLETRSGLLTVERDPGDDTNFQAFLDGRKLADMMGDRATIAAHLAQGARDFVILEVASGGIACPVQYVMVELGPKHAPIVSEEFGSCLEFDDVAFQGAKIVIRMPAHTPHPELLTAAEVRRRERTTYLYSWSRGKIEERAVETK